MTESKCFRDAFRDQLHELSGQPNMKKFNYRVDESYSICTTGGKK